MDLASILENRLEKTTLLVAASSGQELCIRSHTIFSLCFGVVGIYGVLGFFILWLDGSKVSNRKRVFMRLIIFSFMRCAWYSLFSIHLVHAIIQWITPSVESSIISSISSTSSASTPLHPSITASITSMVLFILYYWPRCLLFSANTWLIKNWLQLYEMEKIRKKMAPRFVGRTEPTPSQRKKKATIRLNQFMRLRQICSILVHGCLGFLAPFYCGYHPQLLADEYIAPIIYYVTQYPPDFLISTLSMACLTIIIVVTYRFLANLRRALATDSDKLKAHTLLSLTLSAAMVFYNIWTMALYLMPSMSDEIVTLQYGYDDRYNANVPHNLIIAHSLHRIYELVLVAFAIWILVKPHLSLKTPFPSEAKDITSDWLTTVLRENGTIKPTTTVVAFSTETLRGGVHFKVSRVSLVYSHEKPDDPHKTVVVKLLSWDNSFWVKTLLYLKMLLGIMDKEVMYLRSYQIESEFYKNQSWDLTGFKIPLVYYNLEDCFNERFGMVLQDISMHHDGQPSGFNKEDAVIIMNQLAEFHAANWGKVPKDVKGALWSVAGYWTESKREAVKEKVDEAWSNVLANFKEEKWYKKYADLGARLKSLLPWLNQQFSLMQKKSYRTLCHGDFKITNLFITNKDETNNRSLYVIDFQWFGIGNCCIDVAYFLYTSLNAATLPKIPSLLQTYHRALIRNGVQHYSFDIFMNHAKVILVDFAIYAICSKWALMGPGDVREYEAKMKDGLHLRSMAHMQKIIEDTVNFIDNWPRDLYLD